MAFTAPDDYLEFYDEVVRKSYALIELNYISGITKKNLNLWLDNFKTKEEKYFSSLLLDSIIYRNKNAIISLTMRIIQTILPNILEKLDIYKFKSIKEWEEKLISDVSYKGLPFIFSTIDTVDGKCGKSGHELIRLLSKNEIINRNLTLDLNFSKPNQSCKTVIFLDDLLGSGKQFEDFIKLNLDKLSDIDNIIYCPLVAHETGLKRIKEFSLEISKRIYVYPAEKINEKYNFFYQKLNNSKSIDGINLDRDIIEFHEKLMINNNLVKDVNEIYGFGSLGLLYFFETGIPNNTLPILRNQTKDWNRLIYRF